MKNLLRVLGTAAGIATLSALVAWKTSVFVSAAVSEYCVDAGGPAETAAATMAERQSAPVSGESDGHDGEGLTAEMLGEMDIDSEMPEWMVEDFSGDGDL